MKKETVNKLLLVLSVLSTAILSSCLVSKSENAVDCPTNAVVDPGPFLGQWQILQVLGSNTTANTSLNVLQGSSGVLTAILTEATGADTQAVMLTSINGQVIASVQNRSNSWDIVALSFQGASSNLVISAMDDSVIAADIKSNILAGVVDDREANWQLIKITASGSQLRTYLAGKTNLFGQIAVFQKSP
jgi:hypothetical protein